MLLSRPYKVISSRNSIAHKFTYHFNDKRDSKVGEFQIKKLSHCVIIQARIQHFKVFISTAQMRFEKLPSLMLEHIQKDFDKFDFYQDEGEDKICFWINMQETLTAEEVVSKVINFLEQIQQ